MLNLYQRGDTIIEVLLAITVFSMVSIGAMTIMNQGTNASQRALEITQVRQQIDAQAEALRAAQQAHTVNPDDSEWSKVTGSDSGGYDDKATCPSVPADIEDSFIMDARNATKVEGIWFRNINDITNVNAPPYAQVWYGETGDANPEAYGIWIERDYTDSPDTTVPDSYEFIIKACWAGAGLSRPLTIETSVRLYDPSE